MNFRHLDRIIESTPTSDGAGVKLRRSLGSQRGLYVDPFLMLDEFYSDDPDDYLAGFPAHPHRGFETVTYMLDGHMRHEDHLGNRGDLGPGDVQWMTAARGIIHSEMPQQTEGRMRGFQLWLNLPSTEKMKPAQYRDIPAAQIPLIALPAGGKVKVIAGAFAHDGRTTEGPVNRTGARITTDVLVSRRASARRRAIHCAGRCGPQRVPVCLRGQRGGRGGRSHEDAAASGGGSALRRRFGASRRERAGRAIFDARRQAAARARRAVRTVRDEHAGGDRTGGQRLSRGASGGLTDALDQRRGRGRIANLVPADDVEVNVPRTSVAARRPGEL